MGDSGRLFQHPNWDGFAREIGGRTLEERRGLWRQAARRWAAEVGETLARTFVNTKTKRPRVSHVGESEHLLVVAGYPQSLVNRWANFGEWALIGASKVLAPLLRAHEWPTPILFMHSPQAFDAYLQEIGKDNRLMPAGCFIGPPQIPHIAILAIFDTLELQLIMIHEVVHSLINHIGMPRWLEEGICCHIQMEHLKRPDLQFKLISDLSRNLFWREHGLRHFWTGQCFGGVGSSAGYSLSVRLVRRLLAEDNSRFNDRFLEFVRTAKIENAGDGACRRLYGRQLVSYAAEVLGEGDWHGPADLAAERKSSWLEA